MTWLIVWLSCLTIVKHSIMYPRCCAICVVLWCVDVEYVCFRCPTPLVWRSQYQWLCLTTAHLPKIWMSCVTLSRKTLTFDLEILLSKWHDFSGSLLTLLTTCLSRPFWCSYHITSWRHHYNLLDLVVESMNPNIHQQIQDFVHSLLWWIYNFSVIWQKELYLR